MHRAVTDRYLPPDHHAFVTARPATGRVIVIAPTRAACETIEIAMGLHLDTFLDRTHGAEVRALAAGTSGFGIVAGTGTGKTLAIRPIAEVILGGTPLRVGVVNREREATPETPTWNVIIVTTGIARRWFQDGDIQATDTLVVDEIHQTSAELELCLALGKRVGCRFILAVRDRGSAILCAVSGVHGGDREHRVRRDAGCQRQSRPSRANGVSR